MRRLLLAALVLSLPAAALSQPQAAPEQTWKFETVGDWTVQRVRDYCVMEKTYKDAADEGSRNSLAYALAGKDVVVSLGYEHWRFQGGQKTLTLVADGRAVSDNATWNADGTSLAGKFRPEVLSAIEKAARIAVRFPDGDAEFDNGGFKEGFAALRRCDDIRNVPIPPMADIKAYSLGRLMEAVMRECDLGASAKDLGGVQERLSGMRPHMVPVEWGVTQSVRNRAVKCPSDIDAKDYKGLIALFVAKSPSEFVSEFDRRYAEAKAKAAGTKP